MSILHPATELTEAARRTLRPEDLGHPMLIALCQEVERQAFTIAQITEIVGPQLKIVARSEKADGFEKIRAIIYGENR